MPDSIKSEIRFMNLDPNLSHSTSIIAIPEIPGYQLVKLIGKGAHALVFKGLENKSLREVAIKVLKPSLQKDKDLLRRFRRELIVISKLSHPNIIKIFEVGKHFFVMEYLKYNLKSLLRDRGGKLDKNEALKITLRLAKALEYAHSKGIIHRDIKPANILLRPDGKPVLADFGLVKGLAFKDDGTKPFTILGTPLYMSPEQCEAENIDHLSDIYSLGIVLFEMLSGRVPYTGTANDLIRMHTDSSVPIPSLPPEAKDCQALINQMMAKDKHIRIDAHRVRRIIVDILSGKINEATKVLPQQRKSLLYLLIGLIVAFIIIVILMLVFS